MLPTLDQTLPTDQLRITPWLDPVVDLVGHDLRSPYVERFWLPILGPTTSDVAPDEALHVQFLRLG